MGSPLPHIVANIFLEDLDKKALDPLILKPKMWLRYVGDTFIMWPHGEELKTFHKHINNQHPIIVYQRGGGEQLHPISGCNSHQMWFPTPHQGVPQTNTHQ